MKMRMTAIAATLAFAASMPVSANEVLVTPVATKGNQLALAFDIVSSGEVAGFNFKVSVPGLQEKAGGVASCVADLPKSFDGGCSVTKGGVYVYATSNSPDVALPSGMVSIGKIVLNYADANKIGHGAMAVVEELALFDNQAKALTAKAQVVVDSGAGSEKPGRTAVK
jgi:hypothetical protein